MMTRKILLLTVGMTAASFVFAQQQPTPNQTQPTGSVITVPARSSAVLGGVKFSLAPDAQRAVVVDSQPSTGGVAVTLEVMNTETGEVETIPAVARVTSDKNSIIVTFIDGSTQVFSLSDIGY